MLQILFQIGKNFYGDFSDVATGLGEECLSRTQCHEWYQRFKSGRTSIEDDPKSGRPSTSMDDDHVEKVFAVIRQNLSLTVSEVKKKNVGRGVSRVEGRTLKETSSIKF